jgi:phosphoketolase
MLEPGRFRAPRTAREGRHAASAEVRAGLYPDGVTPRVFLTHTRPEPLLGLLGPLHTGRATAGLGFLDQGGTLNLGGMLFVNRATWAHCLDAVARVLGEPRAALLTDDEIAAIDRRRSPHRIVIDG